ncbi:MAG: M56 family metallopeptidase [Oscillospiraceae bacterium]|nr:M56 family metallopeptidase [Oscillospiraceae bacterium]
MAILLEMTLTGGVLILLVLLLRTILLNRLPKTAFIVMWAVVLLRLLVPVSFFGTTAATTDEASDGYTIEAVAHTETESVASSEVVVLDSYETESEAVTETSRQVNVFRIVWLTGATICAAVLVLSYILSFRRFSRSENLKSGFIASFQSSNKLRRTVTIKLSDKTTTPLTYGIIHPVILLPMGMDLSDQKQLKYVLMHEYIHIRKLDNLLKGISSVAVCIHWFNPLVWVMNKFLSRDIELRCDETLLKHCEGDCRAEYALTLIDLEDKRRRSFAVGTAFAKQPAEERITAIMKYRKATPLSAVAMVLCITMLCAAFVGCGAVGTAETATKTSDTETELSAVATATSVASATAETISEASAGSTTILSSKTDTLNVNVNALISANVEDCDFESIEHTTTLPDGLYFKDGILYNADGGIEGKLKSGDENMVINGTGDAAEGYMFVIIDLKVNSSDSSDSDESDESSEKTTEKYVFDEEANSYTFYIDNYTACYPIYESVSLTDSNSVTVYHLTSQTDSSTIEVEVESGDITYTYNHYTSDDSSLSIRVIYVVPEDSTNICLYFSDRYR